MTDDELAKYVKIVEARIEAVKHRIKQIAVDHLGKEMEDKSFEDCYS